MADHERCKTGGPWAPTRTAPHLRQNGARIYGVPRTVACRHSLLFVRNIPREQQHYGRYTRLLFINLLIPRQFFKSRKFFDCFCRCILHFVSPFIRSLGPNDVPNSAEGAVPGQDIPGCYTWMVVKSSITFLS